MLIPFPRQIRTVCKVGREDPRRIIHADKVSVYNPRLRFMCIYSSPAATHGSWGTSKLTLHQLCSSMDLNLRGICFRRSRRIEGSVSK
ncbi:hypothetical protein V6N13_054785 [Hibiscus sabdariffa]